ncbi:MAG: type I-E CRISPR-associated protein Cas5/CasD [Hyphomicrobiaceae bacterium]|nr:type I-E CRISPR-associated protein Cas5/CasD [Hyphomicrobiaceae bacterium]
MRSFLVITLAAPMASFGYAPGNVERVTAERPTRSALLGLAGAALGIARADEAGQAALRSGLSTASRTIRSGGLLRDYHTYQSVSRTKGRFRTRRDALAATEVQTSITLRDYRCDGFWQAAYAARPEGTIDLDVLRRAFLAPRYPLYAGRKACTLSWPLAPRLIEAETLQEAFAGHASGQAFPSPRQKVVIATDDASLLPALRQGDGGIRELGRTDEPESRIPWQFAASREWAFDEVAVATDREGGADVA